MSLFLFIAGILLVGGSVGLISAALGLGGGLIMVPAFIELIEGMDPHTAKGTSLAVIMFVAATNVWRLNRGHADWQWALAASLALGSIPGSWMGTWLTAHLPARAVLWVFIAFMGVAAVRTFLVNARAVSDSEVRRRSLVAAGIGLLTGLAAGATGLGGGFVLVPLALICGIVSDKRVVALSNTVMTATCLAGAASHAFGPTTTGLPWTVGQLYLPVVPLVFVGAQLGAPLGKRINERMSLRTRKVTMGILLLLISARLAYRALFLT